MSDQQHTLDEVFEKLEQITNKQAKKEQLSLWEIAQKSLIPIVMLIIGWGVGKEVADARQDQEIRRLKEEVRELREPPRWLKNDVGAIKEDVRDIRTRLRTLEIQNGAKKSPK